MCTWVDKNAIGSFKCIGKNQCIMGRPLPTSKNVCIPQNPIRNKDILCCRVLPAHESRLHTMLGTLASTCVPSIAPTQS
jgi:hypothetical protein